MKYDNSNTECVNISDYGSKIGYYNDEIEKLLDEEYENPLGEVKKRIIDFSKHKADSINITSHDFLVIKN